MSLSKKPFSLPVARRTKLRVEELESRVVPYSVSGNAWPGSQLVTLSFMPDGTDLGGVSSNLISSMNARFGSPSVWQPQILKAAQVYAKNTDLNFVLVPDNGAASGSGAYQQGNAKFGDIRIGGYDFGNSSLAYAFLPPPVNNYSIAGDVAFNTDQVWNIGTTYDLFSVAAHEMGHALGLLHSTINYAAMYPVYSSVRTGIDWDDIYGIRSIYSAGAARTGDWNDMSGGGNETFATATDVTPHIQSDLTVLRLNRDITTCADIDFFKVTVPSGSVSTIEFAAQSGGLSLFTPKITVYAANQKTVLGSASGAGQHGQTQTVSLTGTASAGDVVYVKIQSADSTQFSIGKYALSMSFGGAALPVQPPPDTSLLNGNPISGGGGIAMVPRLAGSQTSGEDRFDPTNGGGCGCPACQAAVNIARESSLGTAKTNDEAVLAHHTDAEMEDATATHLTSESVVELDGTGTYSSSRVLPGGFALEAHDVLDLCLMNDLNPW